MAKAPPPPPRFGDLDFEPGIPPEPERDDPFGEDVPVDLTTQGYGSMLGRALDRATKTIDDPGSSPQLADLGELSGGEAMSAPEPEAAPGPDSLDPPPGTEAFAGREDPRFAPREAPAAALALGLDLQPPVGSNGEAMAVRGAAVPAAREGDALSVTATLGRSPSPSPAGPPARRGLLSADSLTNLLGMLAIGLLVAILPARQLAKGIVRDQAEPLLVDLEQSISRPLAVRAGELARPDVLASEIAEATDAARTRFFAIWLVGGLVLGLGAGLIRRS